MNDITVCEKINDDDYEKVILEHRKKRHEMLMNLSYVSKITDKNSVYINMDLLKNFNKLFVLNDEESECLCDLIDNIKIKKKYAEGAVGIVYLITVKNKDYIMKGIPKINVVKPVFEFIDIKKYNNLHIEMNGAIEYNIKKLNNNTNAIFAIGSDSFVNQTFLHMIINEIFKQRIDNYVHQFDAFYCKKDAHYTGFNIMDIANYGDLADYIRNPNNKFDYDSFVDLFKQILFPLSILKCKKYGFVHADFKTNNIFVHTENNKVIYKLADFDKSSIYWNGVRFYNNDPGNLGSLALQLYSGTNIKRKGTEMYYKFDTTIGYDIQYYVMNTPLSIFSSYDIYTFVVSLFREPVIYKMASNIWEDNNAISNLLNIMFFDEDLKIFKENMKKNYDQYETFMNNINNMSNDEYINAYNNRKKKDGSNIGIKNDINNHIMILNSNNKGIGNINNEIKNYRLKIDIDDIYKLFDVQKTVNEINCKLDSVHKNDKQIYHVANNNGWITYYENICVTDCKKNKCDIYDGETYEC